MFARTFVAVLSLLLSVAAQKDGIFKVPTGVASDCSSFLTSLNTNTGLEICLTSVVAATKPFSNSTNELSSDQVTASFGQLCGSTSNVCTLATIRGLLNTFADKCADDLISNQDVSATYDLLYNLLPMRNAICAKDPASGKYCALQPSTIGKAKLELPEGELSEIVMANLDAMGTANTGFLFMTRDADPGALCSSCFQEILAGYVDYEDAIPYTMGVNLSPLLQGQAALWQSVTDNCGSEVAANVAVKGGAAPETSDASSRARSQGALVGAAALGALVFAL